MKYDVYNTRRQNLFKAALSSDECITLAKEYEAKGWPNAFYFMNNGNRYTLEELKNVKNKPRKYRDKSSSTVTPTREIPKDTRRELSSTSERDSEPPTVRDTKWDK